MDEQLNQQANGTGENSTDREAQYKALQSWFTKQAQELKALREERETSTTDNSWEERASWIKSNVLNPEIEKLKADMEAKQRFDDLIDANPQLWKNAKAIQELATLKWVAFEDVIEEYWFGQLDKLATAKSRNLLGSRSLQDTPQKSIMELQWAEREERKAKNATWDKFQNTSSF